MRRFLVLLIDVIIVLTSIWLSFQILHHFDLLVNYRNNVQAFYNIAPFIIPIYLIISYIFGMLSLQRKSVLENLYTVFIVSIGLTVSIMALIYLLREKSEAYPRSIIFLSPILYYLALVFWRLTLQKIYVKKYGKRESIVIGNDVEKIVTILNTKYKNLYQVKYIINEWDSELEQKIGEVNDIFVSEDVSLTLRDRLLVIANDYPKMNFYFVPRISDISIINSKLFPFGDMPIHSVGKLYLKPEEEIMKRIIDVVLSFILLILSLPLILIISIIIKLDGGSVFFIQQRLTKNRKVFSIYKFRSMRKDAEKETGPTLSLNNDKRITKIGKFLRATRLDELPQLWNILKGDMSLVGPRPERPVFAEELEKEIPEFKYRLNVKAGLTGFAQIMGKYNTDFKQKLQYDLYYIHNFSLFKDFLILIQTIKVIFWKENTEGVKFNTSKQLSEKRKINTL